MSDFKDWMSFVKFGALVALGIGVVGIGGAYTHAVWSAATAPARVISKTLEPDNIITNYEWYHDVSRRYEARLGQIRSHSVAMSDGKTSGLSARDVSQYRVELEGMRQSCRDLAAQYNSNSAKINRNIFKGTSLPAELSLAKCDS